MKRTLLILSLLLLTTACAQATSTPAPTQLPLNFPTLAPEDTVPCLPAELKTSSNSNETADVLLMGITLTNQSKKTCRLSNPAQITLLTARGAPINVQYGNMPAGESAPTPEIIYLNPGESKIISLIWQNFCKSLPADGLNVRIALSAEQKLDIALNLPAKTNCTPGETPSSLIVTPYSDPP